MDVNPIDIKIKEFALYLKDIGLLNETNINDFLKKFKNISDNSLISSGNFETDINVGLIYLKENLSKAMLEFYNLMTEERKKIIYLNIYSKFIQKREKDLENKGKKIYNTYISLIIKKYFSNWKKNNKSKNIKNIDNNLNTNLNKENKEIKYIKANVIQEYTKDNFCFYIISNNNEDFNKSNVVINSNNHKILFNTNSSTKFNSNNYNNSIINSNNYINSFLLSSQSRFSNKNSNKELDIEQLYLKPKITKNNVLDRLFYPSKNNYEEREINLYNSTNNKLYDIKKNSTITKKRINNIKEQNNNIHTRKTFNQYKEKEKLNLSLEKSVNPQKKMRNTYNSARPKSYLYNDNKSKNKNNVYERLYEQNKEKRKRQEERIKENINEIKQRANHPIQKKNKLNNFRNIKKNQNLKKNNTNTNMHNTNIYNNKLNIKFEEENTNDKQFVSKNIDEVLFEKSFKGETRYKNNSVNLNVNNNLNNNEQKRKDGQNFIENQRKCIELFNDMIDNEEKKGGKIFNENEKENIFKNLLNTLYKENQNDKLMNKDNNSINEDEKINEQNSNYNNICQSVEIKLK